MNRLTKNTVTALALLPLTVMASFAIAGHHEKDEMKTEARTMTKAATTKDIVDVAVGAGQFNTLAAALTAGGLVETLKSKGPFTVFAPTDAAFAKLPPGTVDALLKPENLEKLQAILTYHVVPGRVMAEDVVKLTTAKTANGASLTIKVGDGGVRVDRARVVKADIEASNGVIHVIDAVLMPQ